MIEPRWDRGARRDFGARRKVLCLVVGSHGSDLHALAITGAVSVPREHTLGWRFGLAARRHRVVVISGAED